MGAMIARILGAAILAGFTAHSAISQTVIFDGRQLHGAPDQWCAAENPQHCIQQYNAVLANPTGSRREKAMFYVLRAKAHVRLGDIESALMDFDYAVRSDRNFTLAYTERANFHSSRGEYELALLHLDQAIALEENDPGPYEAKAWLLATASVQEVRNGQQAVELALRALDLAEDYRPTRRTTLFGDVEPFTGPLAEAFIRDTLAAAYAESSEFENAVAEQERAIAILNEIGGTLGGEQERLAAYRSGVSVFEAPPAGSQP